MGRKITRKITNLISFPQENTKIAGIIIEFTCEARYNGYINSTTTRYFIYSIKSMPGKQTAVPKGNWRFRVMKLEYAGLL